MVLESSYAPIMHVKDTNERNIPTCRNPLNGANPVPGPTMIIGIVGFAGSLKFESLTNIGAQLQSSPTSAAGLEFWKIQNIN